MSFKGNDLQNLMEKYYIYGYLFPGDDLQNLMEKYYIYGYIFSGDVLQRGGGAQEQPLRRDQGVVAEGVPPHQGGQVHPQPQPQELLC